MKLLNPFRISAVLLIFFCAGHTIGGMFGQKSLGPEADAVFAQMKSVHFIFNGSDVTYYGFWFGFGLTASIFLLLSAVISWRFASVEAKDWHIVAPIAWTLILSHMGNTYLSFMYFFVGPGTFGCLIVILMVVGSVIKSRGSQSK